MFRCLQRMSFLVAPNMFKPLQRKLRISNLDPRYKLGNYGKIVSEYDRAAAESLMIEMLPDWMTLEKLQDEKTANISSKDRADMKLLLKELFKNYGKDKTSEYKKAKFEEEKEIIKAYLPAIGDSDVDYKLKITEAYGDLLYLCPTINYASAAAQTGMKVFYYDFQYRPSNSLWADWIGPTQFDEVDFIFGGPLQSPSRPGKELRLSKMMIRHWTNFIKYGNPASFWPFYSNGSETVVYPLQS